MKTPRNKIATILTDDSFNPKFNRKIFSSKVAAYLLETARTGELSSLMRDITQQRADRGTVEVTVFSAHDLTPAIESNIRTEIHILYPKAKHIIINQVLDPEVIGGVRLELPNQQLDLSLRGKLNHFKQLTVLGETK